jgi:DNA anti-recombination protein RmuC
MEIDGEIFNECDFGIVVDNGSDTQKLASQMETLAQAALQNQLLDFSTIMKLYSSSSLAEKQRMVESSERKMQERTAQAQQQQAQQLQQQAQMEQQTAMAKMEHETMLNERDNETKIIVAQINAQARQQDDAEVVENVEGMSEESRAKLNEQIREFDARLALDKERLAFDKDKAKTDARLKEKQINSRPKTTNK